MVTGDQPTPLKRWQHNRVTLKLFYGLSWGFVLFFLYCVKFVYDQAHVYSADVKAIGDVAAVFIPGCALYMLWATWLVVRKLRQPPPVDMLTGENLGALLSLSLLLFVLLSILLCAFLTFAFFATVD